MMLMLKCVLIRVFVYLYVGVLHVVTAFFHLDNKRMFCSILCYVIVHCVGLPGSVHGSVVSRSGYLSSSAGTCRVKSRRPRHHLCTLGTADVFISSTL